ncbi:MAG TPA: zf-HC2 domain-containing protein [Pilimelia sp.]|nr:zf-HC2 domain-containing protein [Pilimelia sp.]
MTCEDIRIALSARLDGEEPGASAAALDAHLAGCAGCAHWLAQAERLTRAVRIQAVAVPDLTAAVLAAVAAELPAAGVGPAEPPAAASPAAASPAAEPVTRRARRQILRLAVALAAAAQLGLALPVLLGGQAMPPDIHLSREMASFDVALAVGFALAAWRPTLARAFVPVALVLAGCLVATTVVDVVDARTALAQEVGHLAVVAQAGLLWALGRTAEPAPSGRAGWGRVAATPA